MAAATELLVYKDALVLLGTAGLVVPLVRRFKLSPVLGFLAAGALLGPAGLGALAAQVPFLDWITVSKAGDIGWLADFGVALLLFVIGLELSLPRLLTMRRLVFGLGGLQVVVTACVIAGAASYLGASVAAASLLGLTLALSSTALVLETLAAQDRLTSSTGRATFSVLLLQDLAVIPVLFLVAILGASAETSIIRGLGQALVQAVIVLGLIVAAGRLLLRPFFRLVALAGSNESFLAAALFLVVGTGVLAAAAGLSMAFGAFVAGLLAAETEYRRAIEAIIDPFKGLLLGVFFFTVGMSIDIGAILRNPGLIVAGVAALLVVKALLFFPMGRAFGLTRPAAMEASLLLAPGGEFAFVIVPLAMTAGLLRREVGSLVLVIVSLTMALLPFLAAFGRRMARDLAARSVSEPELLATPPGDGGMRAIVVGYGRVGQMVTSLLETHSVSHLVTDNDARVVTHWRRADKPIYWGDARQPAFLERCGIAKASALIVTIHGNREIDQIVEAARSLRPDIVLVVRARDAAHAQHLYTLGVSHAVPETIEASLQLAEAALVGLDVPMGPVIASIHEQRDEVRRELLAAADSAGAQLQALYRRRVRR
jgi:CPA2 family monovalent cation:H+ antiporter-2